MKIRPKVAVERVADIVLRRLGLLGLVRALDGRHDSALRILGYHRVCDLTDDPLRGDPNVISATPRGFAEQMRLLARHYTPVGLPEVHASLKDGRPLPPRAVLVTFDDGYRDFLTHAWPILKSYAIPVVLFVPTAFPDSGRRFWWDRVWQQVSQARVERLWVQGMGVVDLRDFRVRWQVVRHMVREMRPLRAEVIEERMAALGLTVGTGRNAPPPVLSWEELRRVSREGVTIGSHSCTHASLPVLTVEEIVQEIEQSQADLKRELGSAVPVFAYPFGHYDARAAAALGDRGFLAAIGTVPGQNVVPVRNRYSLFRQSVNVKHSLSRIQFGLSGFFQSADVS